jgi:hypothetical protein
MLGIGIGQHRVKAGSTCAWGGWHLGLAQLCRLVGWSTDPNNGAMEPSGRVMNRVCVVKLF